MRGRRVTEAERAVKAFRYFAFQAAWTHTLRRESDPNRRFLRAIQITAKPIRPDRLPLVLDWFRRRGDVWHGCRPDTQDLRHA